MIKRDLAALTILAIALGLLAGCTHSRGPIRPDGMSIHTNPAATTARSSTGNGTIWR